MVPQVLFRDGKLPKASMKIFHNNHMISLYHWLSRIPGFIGFIGELDLPSSAAVMLKLILFAGLSAQPPFVSDLRFCGGIVLGSLYFPIPSFHCIWNPRSHI